MLKAASRFSKWSRLFSRKDFFSWQKGRAASSERKKAQTWSSKDNNSTGKKRLFEQLSKLKQQQKAQQHPQQPQLLTPADTSHYFVNSKPAKADINSNFPAGMVTIKFEVSCQLLMHDLNHVLSGTRLSLHKKANLAKFGQMLALSPDYYLLPWYFLRMTTRRHVSTKGAESAQKALCWQGPSRKP